MAIFNYKGIKYTIFFYPCGNMARVTMEGGQFSRDIYRIFRKFACGAAKEPIRKPGEKNAAGRNL